MTPKIYYNDVKFRLRSTRSIKDLILKVIRSEGKRTGDLSFIFTGRDKMLALNVEFLGHDYHTDVITF
ncbi:MAG: rRNA maturation factor, partial [Bacteroidales bacterium]|nr:rRNA maturation factor [Bacteroidales bacterium]